MKVYASLGDSMAIDLYPSMDLDSNERRRPVGAASLLWQNDDDLWPEFFGRDLHTAHEGIRKIDSAVDGGTTDDVLATQIPDLVSRVDPAEPMLITVTAGGNDLLAVFTDGAVPDGAVHTINENLTAIRDVLHEGLPQARVILTTVYDPTDGEGLIPGWEDLFGRLPLQPLEAVNNHIRSLGEGSTSADPPGRSRARVADVHRLFLGHGRSVPESQRWYWTPSPIEPNARGASEIRRAWLDALSSEPAY